MAPLACRIQWGKTRDVTGHYNLALVSCWHYFDLIFNFCVAPNRDSILRNAAKVKLWYLSPQSSTSNCVLAGFSWLTKYKCIPAGLVWCSRWCFSSTGLDVFNLKSCKMWVKLCTMQCAHSRYSVHVKSQEWIRVAVAIHILACPEHVLFAHWVHNSFLNTIT